MTPIAVFLWGFTGSVAVELLNLLSHYDSRSVKLPARYRKLGFWITRSLIALIGGALAVGYDIEQRILAFNIGAATPLIITFMMRELQPGAVPIGGLGTGHPSRASAPAPDEGAEQAPASSHRGHSGVGATQRKDLS